MSKEKLLPDNPTEAVFVAHCLKIGLSTAGEMRGYRRGVMDERSDRRTPAKDEGEKWCGNCGSPTCGMTAGFCAKWQPKPTEAEAVEANLLGHTVPTAPADEGEEKHPEATCQLCGRDNPVWYAENELWNKVMPDRVGIICPICFRELAHKKGFHVALKCYDMKRNDPEEEIDRLQAALNDAHTDSRQQKDRVERLVEGSKEKDKRIEEPEEQHFIEEGLAERCKKV